LKLCLQMDQSTIREYIVQYYDSLFSNEFNWWPNLDGLAFDFIDAVEASRLEGSFKECEV
jgi:hypothetical protein